MIDWTSGLILREIYLLLACCCSTDIFLDAILSIFSRVDGFTGMHISQSSSNRLDA